VIPGSFAVLLFGLLAWWAEHLLLWAAGTRWVTVSLVLFASTVPLVPLVFLPRGRLFQAAFETAVAQGRVSPDLTTAFHDPAVVAARWYELAAVAVIIVPMVTKPL
jgi:hypothetical protein